MKLMSQQGRVIIAGALVLGLALQVPAAAAGTALGTARGAGAAEISLDGGRRWLSLRDRAFPAMAGSQVRTTTGSIALDLADGSRVALAPFSALRLEESGAVDVRYGRVEIRAVPRSAVVVTAGSTRVSPADPARRTVAEMVVDPAAATGVQVRQGVLRVESADGTSHVARAGDAPVVIGRPLARQAMFGARTAAPARTGRPAFGARGENVGYLTADGALVVRAGFARDLSRPFEQRAVAQALARIPETHRSDAAPIFDVDGRYLGYIQGASFHALAGPAQTAPPGQSGAAVDTQWPWHYTVGMLAIAGGVGVAIAVDSDDDPASPTGP